MEIEEAVNSRSEAGSPNDLRHRKPEAIRHIDEIADGETTPLYAEAAVGVGLFKFLRIYCFTTGVGVVLFTVFLLIRMIVMWKVAMYSQPLSVLQFSLLVGTDVGVVAVIISLIVWVPGMIITWITALVLWIVFDGRFDQIREAVRNGKVWAGEITRMTLVSALKGGEIAAIVAAVATLMGLTALKSYVN